MKTYILLVAMLCPLADAGVLRYAYRASDSSASPSTRIPYYYVADTTAELTALTGCLKGDQGFSRQSNLFYFHSGSAWVSAGGGGASWGAITGTLSAQTDLNSALGGKAATTHTHAESDVTSLVSDLAGKAPTVHTHAESAITNLVTDLVAKAASVHTHAGTDVTSAVATATALAANPTDCSAGQYANTIAANGNLTCAQVAYSQVSGTPAIPPAANFVSATVDFGAWPGNSNASVTVTGATWVTASSIITCVPTNFATTDRADGAEDAIIEVLTLAVSSRVAGTGFTVKAAPAVGRALGKFVVNCGGT